MVNQRAFNVLGHTERCWSLLGPKAGRSHRSLQKPVAATRAFTSGKQFGIYSKISSTSGFQGNKTDWRIPSESWDTHVHIFDEQLYPYSPNRSYTPPSATFEQLVSFSRSITMTSKPSNMVLVLPSPYGTQNESVLDPLRKNAKDSGIKLRGIVVVDPKTVSREELLEMHGLGVRGVRLNMVSSGGKVTTFTLIEALLETAEMIHNAGLQEKWWIQLFIPGHFWDDLHELISNLRVKIIADHQGGLKASSMLPSNQAIESQPGFSSLLSLASSKHLVVKFSAFSRASTNAESAFSDLEPIVKRFAKEVPDQLIWSSDWPHTGEAKGRKERGLNVIEDFETVDDVAILRNLRSWVDEDTWRRVMVDNPERMFA